MNPNTLRPHPDANSSSLAYLYQPPPGTDPEDTADTPIHPPPPQLHNRTHPQRTNLLPEQNLMDVDTGTDISGATHDSSPDLALGRGLKRTRPDTDEAEVLEHSEPICKQRRTGSPQPEAPVIILSAEALLNEAQEAVAQGRLDRLQALFAQIENKADFFETDVWKVAVAHGHLLVIDWLFKQADRLQMYNPGYTQLCETAVIEGQIGVLKWLAEQGCDIQQADGANAHLLIRAAKLGNLEVVKWLAGQGCDIQQLSIQENNVLHPLKHANIEFMNWLYAHRYDHYQVGSKGEHALICAASNGHLEVVKWLAEQGVNVQQANFCGHNALIGAAAFGHLEVVKWLAGQGGNLQQATFWGHNALICAASNGHLEVVKWLAGLGCDVHLIDGLGTNVLTYAASNGHLDLAKWLVGQGCDINWADNLGQNALMLAARMGHLDLAKWLAGQGGDVNRVDNMGWNALMWAAAFGKFELVKWLAETGVNINQVSHSGATALSESMMPRSSDTARYLIQRGASLTAGDSPGPDGYLFRALELEDTALINLLIPQCDVSKRSGLDDTALMIAARNNYIDIAIPLIQATLLHPNGRDLLSEASENAYGQLFGELLRNPSIIDHDPTCHSTLSSEGELVSFSVLVEDHVYSQYDKLLQLEDQLGFEQSMTPMQMKSAKVGIVAELAAWKLTYPIEESFRDASTPDSLLPIQKRVMNFISDDVEVIATEAHAWEENHLVPVIEHLYPTCLRYSLSAQAAIGIVNELINKGLYHPIARRIAAAWTNAWTTMSEEVRPLLQPVLEAQFNERNPEDLPDPVPINGALAAIGPDTAVRDIDSFVDTSAGVRLLQAFCTALKNEFDSVDSGILQTNDANLSRKTQKLYADLVMRQLHLIAQFWRTA